MSATLFLSRMPVGNSLLENFYSEQKVILPLAELSAVLSSEFAISRIRCSGRCNAEEDCVAFTYVKSEANCTLRRALTDAERQDGGMEGVDVLDVPTTVTNVVFMRRGWDCEFNRDGSGTLTSPDFLPLWTCGSTVLYVTGVNGTISIPLFLLVLRLG